MREIKFRAWDGIEKRMYEVREIKFIGSVIEPYKIFIDYGHQVEEPVLMQYTGLKDKNGKEIYEGDIVKWYNEKTIAKTHNYEVKFGEYEYSGGDAYDSYNVGFFATQIGRATPIGIGSSFTSGNEVEIIGNIYENPELLTPLSTEDKAE